MTDLVATEDIERVVGAKRHPRLHIARAVSAERRVYILHSQECVDSGVDLRECPYSLALDNGHRRLRGEWTEDEAWSVSLVGAKARLVPDFPAEELRYDD